MSSVEMGRGLILVDIFWTSFREGGYEQPLTSCYCFCLEEEEEEARDWRTAEQQSSSVDTCRQGEQEQNRTGETEHASSMYCSSAVCVLNLQKEQRIHICNISMFVWHLFVFVSGVFGEAPDLRWDWHLSCQLEAYRVRSHPAGIQGLGRPGSLERWLLPNSQGYYCGGHVSHCKWLTK